MKKYNEDWNFAEYSMKESVHGLHNYPAMMMPMIAKSIIEKYGKGENTVVLDPFMGSGTSLVEAQLYGAKKVYGLDLNPLAVLISRAKTNKYNFTNLKSVIDEFYEFYKLNISIPNFTFDIMETWFSIEVVSDLSKIKVFIDGLEDCEIKDFFNLCFSETIRQVSYTRNSEFKLYKMSKKSLHSFNPKPFETFLNLLKLNFQSCLDYSANANFNTDVKIFEENVLSISSITDIKSDVDIVITSPPYGDSGTTVAYGQFSRLANEWLEHKEPLRVDSNLLGGGKKKKLDYIFNIEELDNAILRIKEKEKSEKNKRVHDVVSFYLDYERAINEISKVVKNNGVVAYVVGNRRVRDIELPTDVITAEMFKKNGFLHEETIVRRILNKRMPSKTSPTNKSGFSSSTMIYEYIVILRKNIEQRNND